MPIEILQGVQETAATSVAAVTLATTIQMVPVEHVEPIFENTPIMIQKQICHQSPMVGHVVNPKETTGLIGALLGGAIASRSSAGEFRPFATTMGAIMGSRIGQNMGGAPYVVPEHTYTHCGIGYENKAITKITGYRVRYKLDGKTYKVRTRNHPGKYIQLER